jgi:hypothetical protein
MRMIEQIAEINAEAGGTFFDARTISRFKAKVLPTVYAGKYFISSDVTRNGKRYSVREVLPSGRIKLVGVRHAFLLKSDAKAAIQNLRGLEALTA